MWLVFGIFQATNSSALHPSPSLVCFPLVSDLVWTLLCVKLLLTLKWNWLKLPPLLNPTWWILNVYPHTCSSANTQQRVRLSRGTSRQCLSWVTSSSWIVFPKGMFLVQVPTLPAVVSWSGIWFSVLLTRPSCWDAFTVWSFVLGCRTWGNKSASPAFPFPSANQPSPTLTPRVLMSSLPTSIYLFNGLCPALLSNSPSFFSLSSQSVLAGFTSQTSNMISNILLWPRVWVNIWIGFLPLCMDVSCMCESGALRPLDIGAQYKSTTKTLSPARILPPPMVCWQHTSSVLLNKNPHQASPLYHALIIPNQKKAVSFSTCLSFIHFSWLRCIVRS